jgi:hypothetical protein
LSPAAFGCLVAGLVLLGTLMLVGMIMSALH